MVDNVDLILERIGKDQEWEFRRALSEQSRLLLVGASSRALEQTYEYGRAFYDFFQIHELAGLTEEETLAVLKALAQQYQATELDQLLEDNPGRIQAMRLLTGGNPRTIVLLFKILVQRTQGDIETDLQQLLDEYTPLYKARFEDLAQQAQTMVDAIAVNWDPITAGDLAERVGIPVNTVSAQLQRLDSLGLIEKTPWYGEKKNAFQIAERFFNIWYLMRATRRVRRRLVWLVKFLESWFNETELHSRAQAHLLEEPEACTRLSYADRAFAYAEAIGEGPLKIALENASLHAYLDDDVLRKQFDFSDLPPELQAKKDRMELLRKLHDDVLAVNITACGMDPNELWGLLGGSPHYTLNEKQRIVAGLVALPSDKLNNLVKALKRAKQELLAAYRSDSVAVEKLYELLSQGDMIDVYDWKVARACAESPKYRKIPLIGIQSRVLPGLAATQLEPGELERAESSLRALIDDGSCAASGWHGLGTLWHFRLGKFEEAESA